MIRPSTKKPCQTEADCKPIARSSGKTAYEIAVEQGFKGSEIEWIKYQEGVNAELSKSQADRAESEADRAQGIADDVELFTDTAIAEADRSRDEADRAETEANKSQAYSEISEQARDDALTYSDNAAASADSAEESMQAADVHKIAAGLSEDAAQASALSAEDSENKAKEWATKEHEEEVEEGLYSALHHATESRISADESENSARNATQMESQVVQHLSDVEALRDETETFSESAEVSAANSETSAQASATSASEASSHKTDAETASINANTSMLAAKQSEDLAKESETNAKASETAAKASENKAAQSEATASTSAATATSEASKAYTSAQEAAASELVAQNWAEGDEPGGEGTKSSKQHAEDADNSAQYAAGQASNAAESREYADMRANDANTSATNAAASADDAETSAEEASDSASAALSSEQAAKQSEDNAASSASAAKVSEDNAKDSEESASTSATTATNQANISTQQANTATTQAEIATDKAGEAEDSAQAAAQSETNAASSEQAAKSSETNSKTSETAAKSAENKAKEWASKDEDSVVESGLYSSKHYALKSSQSASQSAVSASDSASSAGSSDSRAKDAEDFRDEALAFRNTAEQHKTDAASSASSASSSATSASNSASTATTQANNAATSASNASDSEDAAKTHEDAAKGYADNAYSSADSSALSASEASASKLAAAGSAVEASDSAADALSYRNTANQYRQAAQSAKDDAESAAATAISESGKALTQANRAEEEADRAAGYADTMAGGLAFLGLWDASNNEFPDAPLVGSAQWKISVGGNLGGHEVDEGDTLIFDVNSQEFLFLDTKDQVTSVNGRIGAIEGLVETSEVSDVGFSGSYNDLIDKPNLNISNWNTAYGWGDHSQAGYALASRTISAGNGLTGGGSLSGNRTINLGTPGTISTSSTNDASGSTHTHELVLPSSATRGEITLANLKNESSSTLGFISGRRLQAVLSDYSDAFNSSGYNPEQWDEAYQWGDHSTEGYLKTVSWGIVSGKPTTATRWPTWSEVTSKPSVYPPASHTHGYDDLPISSSDVSSWNTAASWGNHASAGYAISGTGSTQVRTNSQLDSRYSRSDTTYSAGTGINLSGTTFSVSFGTAAGTVTEGNDSRLSNSREWTASTVSQAEAEAGTATTRRAWTAQRVRQNVANYTDSFSTTGDYSGLRARATTASDVGLGSVRNVSSYSQTESDARYLQSVSWGDVSSKPATATRWPSFSEVTGKPSTYTPSTHTHSNISITAGDGLSGGGNLGSNRTLSVDSTVVRTSGNQTINGVKTLQEIKVLRGDADTEASFLTLRNSSYSTNDGVVAVNLLATNSDTAFNRGARMVMRRRGGVGNLHFSAGDHADVFNIDGSDGSISWSGSASGDGSGITSLNASNLASGTVADARLPSTAVRTSRTITAGDGLSGGGSLASNRTISVDSSVVRTSGTQTIGGSKTFSSPIEIDSDVGQYRIGGGTGSYKMFNMVSRQGNMTWYVDEDQAAGLEWRVHKGGSGHTNRFFMDFTTGAFTANSFSGSMNASNLTGSVSDSRLPKSGNWDAAYTFSQNSDSFNSSGNYANLRARGTTAADVGAPPTSRTITAGDGLSGGGNLGSNRTLSVDDTVVRGKFVGSADTSEEATTYVIICSLAARTGLRKFSGVIYGARSSGNTNSGSINLLVSDSSTAGNVSYVMSNNTVQNPNIRMVECVYNGSRHMAIEISTSTSSTWNATDIHATFDYITNGIILETAGPQNVSNVSEYNSYHPARHEFSGVLLGNGSGLTSLNASRLTSGTVPTARLPAAALIGDTTYSAGTGLSLSGTTFSVSNPFSPSGNYASLRARGTTKADVGLGNVGNYAAVNKVGDTMTGKLVISSDSYQDHLELVRGSIRFGIMPSTGNSGELRFLATNATRYIFDKPVEATGMSIGGNSVAVVNGTYSGLRAQATTKADVGLAGIPNTNGSTANFLRGDGTWVTPPNTNTTYSEITSAEVTAGTSSTLRTITGRRLKAAVDAHGLKIGTTSSTAKAGNWMPSAADVGAPPTSRTITAGDGLSGGGNLTANRTLSVDSTVVRTSGNQSIAGNKEFSTGFFGGIGTSYGNLSSLVSGGTSAGDTVTGLRFVNTGTSAGTKARALFTLSTNAAWENVSLEADRFSGSNMRFNIGIGDGANPPINIAQFYSDRAEINGNLILGEQGTTTTQAVRADRTITAGTGLSGGGNLTANRTLSVQYGTTAGTAAQGNDSRLSNSREWTASTVSQAEAQAGTATTARKWTAQRVSQAISALGLKIGTTSSTAKAGNWTPAVADIPNLPASKITSGTFSAARIPVLDSSKMAVSDVPARSSSLGTTDLNTVQNPGFYHQTSNSNSTAARNYPPAGHAGSLVVTMSAGVVQEYTTYGPGSRKYFRGFYSGTWSNWVEVYRQGVTVAVNDIPNLPASKITSGTISTSRLPASALIGDTTYSAGTGLSLSGTTFSFVFPRVGWLSDGDGNSRLYTSSTAASGMIFRQAAVNQNFRWRDHNNNDVMSLHSGSGNLTANGDITAFSDERLKENMVKIPNALDKIKAVNGYTYDRIDSGERQAGVSAQEVQKVLPEVVHENDEGMLSVAYGNMVGLLIEAVKEQQQTIDTQAKQIAELYEMIKELKDGTS